MKTGVWRKGNDSWAEQTANKSQSGSADDRLRCPQKPSVQPALILIASALAKHRQPAPEEQRSIERWGGHRNPQAEQPVKAKAKAGGMRACPRLRPKGACALSFARVSNTGRLVVAPSGHRGDGGRDDVTADRAYPRAACARRLRQ
jgi:hypothetical protein